MTDFSHRGYRGSITVRRSGEQWLVRTDIFTPRDLVDEMGDKIPVDDMLSSDNPIEQVRAEAAEQAIRIIDDLVKSRSAARKAAT